jgi:hypothetical protein
VVLAIRGRGELIGERRRSRASAATVVAVDDVEVGYRGRRAQGLPGGHPDVALV